MFFTITIGQTISVNNSDDCPSTNITTSGHIVEFMGVNYHKVNGECASTFTYKIQASPSAPAISHVVFGNDLCVDCLDDNADVVSASDPFSVGFNPSTGHCGIKFNQQFSIGQTKIYSFTLKGVYDVGEILFVAKAGPSHSTATICGPICKGISCPAGQVWDDNECKCVFPYIPEADVRIGKQPISAPIISGNELIYEITVSNNGPDNAENVIVTDNITAFENPLFATNINGPWNTWNGTKIIGNLPNHNSYIFYIRGIIHINNCTPVSNTAQVTTTTIDTDLTNNSVTITNAVEDHTPPTIICPADVTVNTDLGLCSASNVELGNPITNDNCTVASVTNNAPVVFPIGNTTVVWTVTDASGNSATCEQTVTVIDNEFPTIACPSDVILCPDSGVNIASNVDLGNPISADNCAVASVTNNAPSVFLVGTTIVTWTVTDASGNTATCEQTVTVNARPTISGTPIVCLGFTTQLTGSGLPAMSNPWVSSIPAIATVSSTGIVAGVSAGTTVITYTDSNGCTEEVTVTVNNCLVTISGNVYIDNNGIADGIISGSSKIPSGIRAVLYNVNTNLVEGVYPLGSGNTFMFNDVYSNRTYRVMITTQTATVGFTPPQTTLPPLYIYTGESIGSSIDNIVDGISPLITRPLTNVNNVNFGIKRFFIIIED